MNHHEIVLEHPHYQLLKAVINRECTTKLHQLKDQTFYIQALVSKLNLNLWQD
jgi:hypothetical protein